MTRGELGHGWQLTGSSVDAYDELLVPAIFEPWAQSLLDLADPRLGVSAWRDIDHSPGYAAFADALERHAGAGGIMRAPFAFDDRDSLRRVLLGAGFDGVRIVIDVKVCRFPR